MKKGEIYKVYEDPLTKTKLEGYATIVRIEDTQTFLELGYHYCAVKFDRDNPLGEPTVHRKIDEQDKVK
jgi:hypothetical protein